ncbi:ferritin [bacterium]|nr:ferritin [bacterium]
MLEKKMQKALNEQINAEIYSAYMYLSMSAWFESNALSGFANWMRVQYEEEMFHAMKFYNFVHDRGGQVLLKAIDGPPTEWKSVIDVFEATLQHERHVSALIHKLVDLSTELKDHATNQMLQWFVEEQVEEEANAEQILDELKLIGDAKSGLFMLNRELSQRTFTPPAGG